MTSVLLVFRAIIDQFGLQTMIACLVVYLVVIGLRRGLDICYKKEVDRVDREQAHFATREALFHLMQSDAAAMRDLIAILYAKRKRSDLMEQHLRLETDGDGSDP